MQNLKLMTIFFANVTFQGIVVDLIKEAMLLKAKLSNGYVINGFPRTSKQAFLFVNEIGNVDVIIYLHGKIDEMAQRVHNDLNSDLTNEVIKRNIGNYMKEIKEATHRFGPKIQKVIKTEKFCLRMVCSENLASLL